MLKTEVEDLKIFYRCPCCGRYRLPCEMGGFRSGIVNGVEIQICKECEEERCRKEGKI